MLAGHALGGGGILSILRFVVPGSGQAAAGVAPGRSISKAWQAVFCVLLCIAVTAVVLSACSRGKKSAEQNLSKRVVALGQPVPKGGGRYKVGSPYKIGGRWYTPREDTGYNRVGVASWYGEMFHGRYTANGEIYDMNALTAAHPTLPLPTYARVTNLQNGRSIVVRVNDRGPYAADRIIDMSRRSAQALGFKRNGTAKVRVQYMGLAPIDGNDSLERRVFARQPFARMAGLSEPEKKFGEPKRHTRLAQAVRKELQSDPMVVGSIPDERTPAKPVVNEWATQTEAAAAPPAPKAGPALFIQAASFRSRDFADALRGRLADMGPADVLPADVAGQTYYRVRLGPFAARHDADEALRAVVGSGFQDARIVRN